MSEYLPDLTITYSSPLDRNVFILSKNNLIRDADLYTEFSKLGIYYCNYANAWITGGQISAKI